MSLQFQTPEDVHPIKQNPEPGTVYDPVKHGHEDVISPKITTLLLRYAVKNTTN